MRGSWELLGATLGMPKQCLPLAPEPSLIHLEGLRFCLEVGVAANWDDGSHCSVASSAQGLCICPDLCIGPGWYVSRTQKLSIRAAGLLIDLVGCPARHLGLS